MRHKGLRIVLTVCALAILPDTVWAQFMQRSELDGRTREQRAGDPRLPEQQPYLGLHVGDRPDESGVLRCRVLFRGQPPGPLLQADSIRRGDYILALNDVVIQSALQFGQVLDRLPPGSDAMLRVKREPSAWPTKAKGTEEVVTVRVASRAEWATPADKVRPPAQRVKPGELILAVTGQTKFEQFLSRYLDKFRIRQPFDDLRKYLIETVERFYGANMLDRVAYAFYNPTRMAELQASMTGPLARIVDQSKGDPWAVASPILEEAAKNLDISFSAGKPGQIDMAHPAQVLKDASSMVHRARAQLERAFTRIDAKQFAEMEASLPELLEVTTSGRPSSMPVMRARMASTVIDYVSLFAAGEAMVSWRVSGEPPASGRSAVAVPQEIAGAVKGEVLAAERIEGRWYIYGGPGPNEYNLSRIDVVIDPGGNDRYFYDSVARPKVQLVVDWVGDDVYSSEGRIPGPASAMLGVSILVDHQGNDRYEGGFRSGGVGVMGIGLILDHAGNDTYKGTRWSLGFGRYGFGGIIDLEDPPAARPKNRFEYPDGSDLYFAQDNSQGFGGPRGFGLILDGAGRDLYRLSALPGALGAWGDRTVSSSLGQGAGMGEGDLDNGGIGILCDLAGDDRYEAGAISQGVGWNFGLGVLYDRSGNDLYYGTRYSQGAAAHGGVGILADDSGDDSYWGGTVGWDLSLALLIDRGGNDSYQGDPGTLGSAGQQAFSWLIDLEGHDRYISHGHWRFGDVHENLIGLGESSSNEYNYKECYCFSFSALVDSGGTSDFYSRPGRGDGIIKATGAFNAKNPELSSLHGLFIDTPQKVSFWP